MPDPSTDDLVAWLARLSDDKLQEVIGRARTARRRLMQSAVQSVRARLKSKRRAAEAIEDATNGRHGRFAPDLLTAIKRELEQELGTVSDIPGSESTRRW